MDDAVAQKVKTFFSKYPLRVFDKGQILIYANEDPRGIFYVVKGQVRQYDITEKGDEVVVNVFKSPAFFPLSVPVAQTPNAYFFEAYTAVEARQAPADEVVAFLKGNADVMFDLLQRLYRGVDGLQRRMAHLMGGSGHSRVLFELIIQCSRFGERRPDGSYVVNVHESELAQRAGLSRETVNRELKKLKSDGLLEIRHKNIEVRDFEKLKELLGPEI